MVKLTFEVLDERRRLVKHYKYFDTMPEACTALREIKGKSYSKPIIEEVTKKGKNV